MKTFYFIRNGLDKMLSLESELDNAIVNLQASEDNITRTKKAYENIQAIKNKISKLFIQMQNKIISTCFSAEFHRIKNLEDVKDYQTRVYNFKNLLGTNSSYEFYNKFYCKAMEELEAKKEKIENEGQFNIEEEIAKDLTVVKSARKAFSLWRRILIKFKYSKSREELL